MFTPDATMNTVHVYEYGELIAKYAVPPNATPPVGIYCGEVELVALFERLDLSFQVVIVLPDKIILEVSAPSSHKVHPGMLVGRNIGANVIDVGTDTWGNGSNGGNCSKDVVLYGLSDGRFTTSPHFHAR